MIRSLLALLLAGHASAGALVAPVSLKAAPVARAASASAAATVRPLTMAALPAPVAALSLAPRAHAPAATPAAESAGALGDALAAVEAARGDAAPALFRAFDGGLAPASADAVPAAPEAPTPAAFARKARALFLEARRAESARAAARAAAPEGVPTDGDMKDRLEKLPSTNPEREKFMVELFKLAGAKAEDIRLQDVGRGRNNIIVTKKGKTDRVIVIGGHHDKVSAGLGKIDNGTGATMVANLYQAFSGVETDATLVFIGFAREEEGLIGSAAYVRSLSQEQRGKIDAMINLDTLGVDGTFLWKNNSTPALLARVAQAARAAGRPVTEATLNGGDSDSSSFRRAGVPAMTIYGASEDVIFDKIHSENDNMSNVVMSHYVNAYHAVLAAARALDAKALGPVARAAL